MSTLPTVLFWMPRASEIPGGHNVQLDETAKTLAKLGVDVRISRTPDADFDGVDIVHGFVLDAQYAQRARAAGKRVAISDIYGSREFRKTTPPSRPTLRVWLGRTRRAGRMAWASLRGPLEFLEAAWQEVSGELDFVRSFEAADLLLPNAQGELDDLRRDLGVLTPAVVVPNGVDPDRFTPPTDPGANRTGILCVGRLEPHKNQLGLIRALRGMGVQLTIAGREHPHHPDYARACRRAGAGWVRFESDADLPSLYRAAEVHVLTSWFETTGLVSLEAALSGSKVVTTDRGHAREYFGDLVSYCDPAEPETIRRAVQAELSRPATPALREHVLSHFTWRHVAEATLSAYQTLMDRAAAVSGSPAEGNGQ